MESVKERADLLRAQQVGKVKVNNKLGLKRSELGSFGNIFHRFSELDSIFQGLIFFSLAVSFSLFSLTSSFFVLFAFLNIPRLSFSSLFFLSLSSTFSCFFFFFAWLFLAFYFSHHLCFFTFFPVIIFHFFLFFIISSRLSVFFHPFCILFPSFISSLPFSSFPNYCFHLLISFLPLLLSCFIYLFPLYHFYSYLTFLFFFFTFPPFFILFSLLSPSCSFNSYFFFLNQFSSPAFVLHSLFFSFPLTFSLPFSIISFVFLPFFLICLPFLSNSTSRSFNSFFDFS